MRRANGRRQMWLLLHPQITINAQAINNKFYVGKTGMGLLYLFTFGLFGFGWLIDIIMIAVGSFRDEFDLPLR